MVNHESLLEGGFLFYNMLGVIIIMKKFFFVLTLVFSCFMSEGVAFGYVDNCPVNLIPNDEDWVTMYDEDWQATYFLRGEDGSMWQRAVISNKNDHIYLREGMPASVRGFGQPFSEIQAFVFAPIKDADGRVAHPGTGDGVCFNLGIADQSGSFSFAIHSSILWALAGEDMVFDIYTRLEESWDQYKEQRTNKNFFIGTHRPFQELSIKFAPGRTGTALTECARLCDHPEEEVVYQALRLNPIDVFSPNFLGKIFDPLLGGEVTLGRNPEYTFYAQAKGVPEPDEDQRFALTNISMMSLSLELLKRALLANPTTRGMDPGVDTISAAEFLLALDIATEDIPEDQKEEFSEVTRELLQSVKNLLTGEGDREENAQSLSALLEGEEWESHIYFLSAFPALSTEASWAQDLENLFIFWTGKAQENMCIMENAMPKRNFTILDADPVDLILQCGMVYANGITPKILLHIPREVSLSPSFSEVKILSANRPFDTEESWKFSKEEKKLIDYRYAFTAPYSGDFLSSSCVEKESLPEYISSLSQAFFLTPTERDLLVHELQNEFPETGLISISLANPEDISNRFQWIVNGKNLSVLQLFFHLQKDRCDTHYLGDISYHISKRDAFEVGLLE